MKEFDILFLFKWIDRFFNGLFDAIIKFFGLRDIFLADIELTEGEEILHVTARHWLVLFGKLVLPFIVMVFFGVLAFYRGIGGSFLVIDGGSFQEVEVFFTQEMDIINRFIVGTIGLMFLLFAYSQWRAPGQQRYRQILLIIGSILALLLYFRLQGGQVFYIDPLEARPFDLINLVLIAIVIGGLLRIIYLFVDWANDQLVLTNKRVIREDEVVIIPKLIERKSQDQIEIDNIQSVKASSNTYVQNWFNYGTVTIQSASVGSDNLEFEAARNPGKMQSEINALVKALQGQESTSDYTQMIDKKVYNISPPKAESKPPEKILKGPPVLRRLLEENPVYDAGKGTYTWHPHWLFLLQALIGPFLLLSFGLIAIFVAFQINALTFGWMLVALVALLLIFVVWSIWQIEDYRNDKYILTPTNVVDIEKTPIGPENRLTASLEALQNVSFQTTFLGNWVGYGDVVLTTAGGGADFTFTRVPNPSEVVDIINTYRDEFKKGEKERSLNEMLTVLHHYHEAQKRHNELRIQNP
ncbi:MAG: PH domain-containing protein [Chloroflexales bacterium]|nr:PH domain-containing protein [Chloroflexales bacterium]